MTEFKVGDKVICIDPDTTGNLVKGRYYVVEDVRGELMVVGDNVSQTRLGEWCACRFVKAGTDWEQMYRGSPAYKKPHLHHHTRDAHPGVRSLEEVEGLKKQNKEYQQKVFDLECDIKAMKQTNADYLERRRLLQSDIKRLEARNSFLEYKLKSIKDLAT